MNRRAGALGLTHHADDLREQRVGSNAFGLHDEAAGAVEGASCDFGCNSLLDRDGLTADQGLIDGTAALGHHAIGGDILAWAHAEFVADPDGL